MKDEAFFKKLFENERRKVFNICLGFTHNLHDAEDLMQETFKNVWRGLDNFRNDSKAGTWVYRIAINTCFGYAAKRKRGATELVDEKHYNISEPKENKEEQLELLLFYIRQLDESNSIIITMLLEEIPYPEIAAALGISEGNLRVKIHRAKNQLTQLYQHHERL